MNTFIVGAGFTKAAIADAPLNRDLVDELARRSPTSAAGILRGRYNTHEIEIALTRLDTDIALAKAAPGDELRELLDLRSLIETELANYFKSFCASETLLAQLGWLTNLIDAGFKPGDVAISLNYDCVLEGALDCREKWSPRGGYGSSFDNVLIRDDQFPKSPVTVLKIHGSASFAIAPYIDKPSASAIGFLVDECFFPRSAKSTHFGFGLGKARPYIMAPSYVKIPTVEISYLMLDALAATTEARHLVVIGCALRPEDGFLTLLITNFLRQPSWRKRKIVVVDLAAKVICTRLQDYWGIDVSRQILPIEGHLETTVPQLIPILSQSKCWLSGK